MRNSELGLVIPLHEKLEMLSTREAIFGGERIFDSELRLGKVF